jgi:hypothetical protein
VQALIADGLDYEAEVAPPPSQPITSAQDKEKQPKPKQPVGGQRIKIIPFDEIRLSTERRYLVKGLVPRVGLCVAWGPPKCGKSFWAFDLSMHIALG